MGRSRLRAVTAAGFGFLLVATAPAQWARLQRCRHALPCSAPMAVRYAPDPLISGQYGEGSPTGVSARIGLQKTPTVELDRPKLSRDASEEAARRFLLQHPPPTRRSSPARPSPTPPPRSYSEGSRIR